MQLNEALAEISRLEEHARQDAHTIKSLSSQLAEERLNTSAMRVHLEACTAFMRGPSQLHTARNLLDSAREAMEACTSLAERIAHR
jgi:uncharacterized coiled-coil protein SlyX